MYQELEIDLNTGEQISYAVDESGNRVGLATLPERTKEMGEMVQFMDNIEGNEQQMKADSAPPAVSKEMENKVLSPGSDEVNSQTTSYTIVGTDTELDEESIMKKHNERRAHA